MSAPVNRPDSFFDYGRAKRTPYSDTELLDFLEDLGAPSYRIVLHARQGWWELHTTGNQLEGYISTRRAIEEFARSRCYAPRESEPTGWRWKLRKLAAMLGVSG